MRYIKIMIGRFQPPHNGHMKVIHAAIDTSDLLVIVLGSAQESRTFKNPFTVAERSVMMKYALREEEKKKVAITHAYDHKGNDEDWVAGIEANVEKLAKARFPNETEFYYTLVGCHKGSETYYLGLYKKWHIDLAPQSESLNATDIRRDWINSKPYAAHVPPTTRLFLELFANWQPEEFEKIVNDFISSTI